MPKRRRYTGQNILGHEIWTDVSLAEDMFYFQNPPIKTIQDTLKELYRPMVIMSEIAVEVFNKHHDQKT